MEHQLEIEIPIQPPRVTLHRARELRDELIRKLSARNPDQAIDVNAIGLNLGGRKNDFVYHSLHSGYPVTVVGKRGLAQLREVALFIAALEKKGAARNGAH